MDSNIIKDIHKYKQAPYYEGISKRYRKSIQRAIRHYDKILILTYDWLV